MPPSVPGFRCSTSSWLIVAYSSARVSQPAPFATKLLDYVLRESREDGDPDPSNSPNRGNTVANAAAANRLEGAFSHLMAASYRTNKDHMDVPDISLEYFWQELDVSRLNQVHTWLWTAGPPMPPRALHCQKMLGREITMTEQMDLHLVWSSNRFFIKPIPRFLLDPGFWVDCLSCKAGCLCSAAAGDAQNSRISLGCEESRLRECALGFLMSYTALISHESDFIIAQEMHLLPDKIPWLAWKAFVKELLRTNMRYADINKRFIYGELRLKRLNAIYRLSGISIMNGYYLEYNQYGSYFRENFAWLASLFVFVVVILTAMQVGLATERLGMSRDFQAASYDFAVLSIVGSLGLITLMVGLFLIIVVCKTAKALLYEKVRWKEIELRRSSQSIASP